MLFQDAEGTANRTVWGATGAGPETVQAGHYSDPHFWKTGPNGGCCDKKILLICHAMFDSNWVV